MAQPSSRGRRTTKWCTADDLDVVAVNIPSPHPERPAEGGPREMATMLPTCSASGLDETCPDQVGVGHDSAARVSPVVFALCRPSVSMDPKAKASNRTRDFQQSN